MKTAEKKDYGFRSESQFVNNYSFSADDFRIKQMRNRNFIVPWQMEKEVEEEVLRD